MNISKTQFDDIRSYLEHAMKNSSVEFETIFNQYKVTKEQFDRVFQVLNSKDLGFTMKIHAEELDISTPRESGQLSSRYTVLGIPNIKKYCKTNKLDDIPVDILNKNIAYLDKRKASPIILNEYPIKITLKNETIKDYDPLVTSSLIKKPKTFRLKKRFSFIEPNKLFRFDLTIVKTSKKQKSERLSGPWSPLESSLSLKSANVFNNPPEYEIELEYIGNKNENLGIDINDILKLLFQYYTICLQPVKDSDCIMSFDQERNIIQKYMNLTFPSIKTNSTKLKPFFFKKDYFIGPQPVTLERVNVRNVSKESNIITINNYYSVTDKADGQRNLLFINDIGDVYTINQKMKIKFTGLQAPTLNNSIFDGEYIKHNSEHQLLETPIYAIFDIYFYQGNDVRNRILSNPAIAKGGLLFSDYSEGRWQLLEKIKFDSPGLFTSTRITNTPIIVLKTFSFCYKTKDSIFNKSNEVLSQAKLQQTYYVDGLIYTPILFGVAQAKEGEFPPILYSGKTWNRVFKWKPPDDNSIDFKVKFLKEKGKSVDYIGYEIVNSVTYSYKIGILEVGISESDLLASDACKSLYNIKRKKDSVKDKGKHSVTSTPFKPKINYSESANQVKLYFSSDAVVRCVQDNTEIKENDIVEFSYTLSKNSWVPLRSRLDKTFPNYYTVANSVWSSIQFPITDKMIIGSHDIPNIDQDEELYWAGSKSNVNFNKYTKSMRNFHNLFVKQNLFSGTAKLFTHPKLLDIGCGKGGDISRWCNAQFSFVLAIDYTKNAIEDIDDGACVRYHEFISKPENAHKWCAKNMHVIFAWGNCAKVIDNGDAGEDQDNKLLLQTLYGSIDKDNIKNPELLPLYKKFINPSKKELFDIISCQFTLHYLMVDDQSITDTIHNISFNLNPGGFFIGTLFDGITVFNKLSDIDEGSSKQKNSEDGTVIWKITKKYSHKEFTPEYSYPIDVYIGSIGQTIEENLLNFDSLVSKLETEQIYLVDDKDAKTIGFPSASGTFDTLFSLSDKSKLGKASDMKNFEREYSELNRWFIFKKTDKKVKKKKTKIKLVKNPP